MGELTPGEGEAGSGAEIWIGRTEVDDFDFFISLPWDVV